MDEHVLAVARPVLEPAEELDQLGRQSRHARVVRGLLAGLPDHELDLGAGLVDDLLDPPRVDAPVGDELREGEARGLAPDRVEAAQHDRLGRVVDDQVDARRLLERPDVAPLAADDPALHLVARQVDHGHRVLGGVVGGHALHRRHDDLAGLLLGLVAGSPLDRPGELDRVVLGLLADRLEQDPLGVLGAQAGDLLQGGDPLLVEAPELLALVLEVALPVRDLAALLLEHVRPLVELLVAREQTPLEVLELASLRAGLLLRLALQPQLLVLRLEDHVLLLGARLGHDPRRLVLGGLDGLAGPRAADDESRGHADDGGDHHRRNGDDRFHLRFLPSGGRRAGGVMC